MMELPPEIIGHILVYACYDYKTDKWPKNITYYHQHNTTPREVCQTFNMAFCKHSGCLFHNFRYTLAEQDGILDTMFNHIRCLNIELHSQFICQLLPKMRLDTLSLADPDIWLKSKGTILDNRCDDSVLSQLTTLNQLWIDGNKNITDSGISVLTNLTHLHAYGCNITDNSLKYLTKLKSLTIAFVNIFGSTLPDSLQSLSLEGNTNFQAHNLTRLSNLTNLTIDDDTSITDDDCCNYLTNLQHLKLISNETISNRGIGYLTTLKTLELECDDQITDISPLLLLIYVDLEDTRVLPHTLYNLRNLRLLAMNGSPDIPVDILSNLTNLRDLMIGTQSKLTVVDLFGLNIKSVSYEGKRIMKCW